jgi:hypothetical protein
MVTKRGRKWLTRGVTIALVVVSIGLFAATWYYSGEIVRQLFGSRRPEPAADVSILEVSATSVIVAADSRTVKPGRWGLAFAGGYLEVGEVGTSGGTVTRAVLATEGVVSAGGNAAWDRMAFSTPEARGIEYLPVVIEGPIGPLRAWMTEGILDTWVVFVHGAGADRREALRAIPTATALGLPTLTISYRNDGEAPPSSSGRHGYGRNEWSDLHAAVDFARKQGAERTVLVGYGSGGSVVSVFMGASSLADTISGLVLDAPVLDLEMLVDRLAANDQVPHFIVGWARAMATFRFGVEWDALDQQFAPHIAVPVLLFHGVDDDAAPIESSRAFAEALAHLATLVEVDGAGHGEAWNVNPDAYEEALGAFLERVSQPTGEDATP